MIENKIQQIWKNGGANVNGWLNIPSSWSAEVMAMQGFDSLTIDMQHGMMSYETTVQMLQAISITDTTPIVRVNWNEPGIIMKVLDAGAMGVICPMVNTRAECEAFVGAARYHPDGYRSLGPTRAAVWAGADYAQHANDRVLTIAMVETHTALENVEEIVSVPGLDSVYIGPGDLSLCVRGVGGVDIDDMVMIEAYKTILDACKKNGVTTGIHCASPEYAKKMIAMGFQMVTLGTDSKMLSTMAKQQIAEMRGDEKTADSRTSSVYS